MPPQPFLLAVLLVAGCSSPSMFGQPMQVVHVADSAFKVYMRSGTDLVEGHRVSLEALPSKNLTLTKAMRAIEIATGCGIEPGSLHGDPAIINAEVDCILP